MLHQFDAAVLGAAILAIVAGERRVGPVAEGSEPLRVDAVPLREHLDHGGGAGIGKGYVRLGRTHRVGVADHPEFQRWIGLQELGDLLDRGLRLRLQLGFAEVEENDCDSLSETRIIRGR